MSGSNFGSAPTGMPFTGDTDRFKFLDSSNNWAAGNGNNSVTLNYQSWSNSQIVINGFSGSYGGNNVANPGDSVTISVWNNGQETDWSGQIPNPLSTPSLTSPHDWYESTDGTAPTLCWQNNGGAVQFYAEVYQSAANANSGWISGTCWRPSDLDGRYFTYQWHVKARNSQGTESDWSGTWHFTIRTPSLSVPVLSGPANGASFNEGASVTVSWQPVSGANDYVLQTWSDPANIATVPISSTSLNIGQMTPAVYSWHVKARNSATESAYSSPDWTFTVKPAAPSGLAAQVLSGSQIKLTWTNNSASPASLTIYRNGSFMAPVSAGTTTIVSAGLDCATSYSYSVTAVLNGIESDHSNTATATTQACPALSASPATVTAGDPVTVSWNNIPNPTTNDYIGLNHPGDPLGSSINWLYVSCSQQPAPAPVPSGSCTFRMPPVTQSTAFQFRYFSNGTSSNPPIATSNTVTVNPRPTPAITSMQFSGAGQALQITINGAGFGNPPMTMPYTGDTSFFLFSDLTKNWNAGGDTDTITLGYTSWSDTKIQINGFAGSYGQGSGLLDATDTVRISFPNSPVGPTSSWQGLPVNGTPCALLSGAVPANQGPPACPNGVDSATSVTAGQRLTIIASGYGAYGNDVTASCSGVIWTDPSGNRYSSAGGGASCGAPKIDPGSVSPANPIGELLGRIGTSGAWFAVGASYTGSAATSGELYLLYNDSPSGYADNAGQYAVTVSVATPTGSSYHAVTPTRIFDSRLPANAPAIGPGQVRCFPVAGVGVVPGSATAVVLNVAVTDTTSASYLTVFPSGQTPPNAANLNWVPGMTVPNLVMVKVGPDGQVCATSPFGTLDLVVDLQGYFAPPAQGDNAGRFQPLAPSRIYDTRFGPGSLGPQETRMLKVAGLGGLPQSGMSAVVMNVSVTNPTSDGFLAVFPGGVGWPGSSNLNWSAGETVPNRVIVPVDASGQINLYNAAGRVDVILDINGWFTNSSGTGGGSLFYPLTPARILDSRFAPPAIGQQQTRLIAVAGQGGVPPSGATALAANIAVTDTSNASYLAAFPGGTSWPGSSDLNWTAGKTVPNLAVIQLGNGGITVYNALGTVDVVVDVAGYFQ